MDRGQPSPSTVHLPVLKTKAASADLKSYRYRQRQHEQRFISQDAQPVAFERSAASGYLRRYSQSRSALAMILDLVQRGCDLSYDYVKINAEYLKNMNAGVSDCG